MALTVVTREKTKIGTLELDAAISTTHTGAAEASEHAVEEGGNITDHVRAKPEEVKIEGVVSNTPVGKDREGEISSTRATGAFEGLRALRKSGEPVTLITELATYKDMVLVDLSVPRTSKNVEALFFTATFRAMRKVGSRVVVVELPRANKKQNLGNKPKTTASAAVEGKASLAVQGAKVFKWIQ